MALLRLAKQFRKILHLFATGRRLGNRKRGRERALWLWFCLYRGNRGAGRTWGHTWGRGGLDWRRLRRASGREKYVRNVLANCVALLWLRRFALQEQRRKNAERQTDLDLLMRGHQFIGRARVHPAAEFSPRKFHFARA